MRLVGRIDSDFDRKPVLHVDVREDSLLIMLANPLSLHVVNDALLIKRVANRIDAVGKYMQVDFAARSHMAGHHAADEARPMPREQPHDAERFQSHLAEMAGALAAFMQARKRLNLVAYFGIAGQIGRLHPTLADTMRGLLLRAVILRLLAGVHQSGGFPGDLPPELALLHRWPPKPKAAARGRESRNQIGGRVGWTRPPIKY